MLVVVSITCLASTEIVDSHSQRQHERQRADGEQQIADRLQQYSLNGGLRSNEPSIEQLNPMQSNEGNLGHLLRSTRAREEASPLYIEAKRRRSKRLQMMAKDEDPLLLEGDIKSGQREQEEMAKQVLRKRWHKLADDLIDDVFASKQQENLKTLDTSYKKKKWFTKQQQQQERSSDNGFEKIMILMKKPLSETASDPEDINTDNENNNPNNLLLTLPPQKQQQTANLPALNSIRRPNVNTQEHARRILDDRFGIMKESIFTTNNHLGLKGVPKFGSDEEY